MIPGRGQYWGRARRAGGRALLVGVMGAALPSSHPSPSYMKLRSKVGGAGGGGRAMGYSGGTLRFTCNRT